MRCYHVPKETNQGKAYVSAESFDDFEYLPASECDDNAERSRSYTVLGENELDEFCRTIAFLWQIHPFLEGNTRSVAVFSKLYLRHLGFAVGNDPFAMRALLQGYPGTGDVPKPRCAHLPRFALPKAFLENTVGRANNELDREELVCTELFEHPGLLRNIPPYQALDKRNLHRS